MKSTGYKGSKKRTVIWVIMAVILVLSAFFVSYYMNWFNQGIDPVVLPSPPASASPDSTSPPASGSPGSDSSPSADVPPSVTPTPVRVDVDKDNVQEIIKTLARPAAYQAVWRVELFWTGGSSSVMRKVYVRDEYTKFELYDEKDTLKESHISGKGKSFVWTPGGSYWQTVQGKMTPDDEAGLPTYESLLSLDKASILTAEYLIWEDIPCIYAEVKAPKSNYTDCYWLSLIDGMPVRMESKAKDSVTYRCTRSALDLTPPDDEVFRLPNNQLAMEIK